MCAMTRRRRHLRRVRRRPRRGPRRPRARRGEDWAARHHFSRFHFDRMIKSVGGEPPQALRRRILLERAAYRMITTKAPLLDIAVEAGYSSHEAFTRAFTRAYGVAAARVAREARAHPDRRRRATSTSYPPGQPPAAVPRQGDRHGPRWTKMVEHHIWLTGEMVRARRAAHRRRSSTSRSWLESTTTRRRIRSLLSRLVGQMGMWNAAMATRDYDWWSRSTSR